MSKGCQLRAHAASDGTACPSMQQHHFITRSGYHPWRAAVRCRGQRWRGSGGTESVELVSFSYPRASLNLSAHVGIPHEIKSRRPDSNRGAEDGFCLTHS